MLWLFNFVYYSPDLPAYYSPSVGRDRKNLLDSIVESAENDSGDQKVFSDENLEEEEEDESEETEHLAPVVLAKDSFAAAATAELDGSDSSMQYFLNKNDNKYHRRDSSSSNHSHSDNKYHRRDSSSSNHSHSDNYLHDSESVGGLSQSSAHRFFVPPHLSDHGSLYSASAADDSSADYDDSSTGGGSWYSHHSHSRSGSQDFDFVTTERLAKFEREQEIMFQTKKYNMERELSNVLERNAVKSVS